MRHCFDFENVFTPVFTPVLIFPWTEVVLFYKTRYKKKVGAFDYKKVK